MDSQQQIPCDKPAAGFTIPHPSRLPTIRSHLARLVLACVLPVWLIAGFLVYYAYESKRALVTGHMLETARALSMSVDQELANAQAALQALATSPVFHSGDLAGIHGQALELLRSYPKADIIVADATGQQLVNSYRPFGSILPKRNTLESVRRIFQYGKPVISDLFFGAVTKRPLISIDVPVFRNGVVVYDLSMTLPSDRLGLILSHQQLPPEWYGTILDSKGVVVTRTRHPERFVGSIATPTIRQAMAKSPENIIKVTNLENTPVFVAFSRSTASNWTVVIGIPVAIAMRHMYTWLGWAIGCAAILSLFGIALAMRISSRIAQSTQTLVPQAMAIGHGEPATDAPPHSVRETGYVAEALIQASRLLENRAAERDRAEESVRESEVLYRSLVTAMAEGVVFQAANGEITAVNPAAEKILDRTSHQLLGLTSLNVPWKIVYEDGTPFPGEHHPSMVTLRSGEPQSDVVMGIHRPDGTLVWISVNSQPLIAAGKSTPYAVVTTFHDITKRKRAEEALLEQERHVQSLLRLSRRLERALSYEEAVNAARDEVRTIIGYRDLWVFLLTEDKRHLKALVAGGPLAEKTMSEEGSATLTIQGDRMLEEIAEAKNIVVVEDARTDERTDKEMVARMGNRTIVNIPVFLMDEHLGTIGTGTYGDDGVRVPTKSEQEYLVAMASHMAVTLDRIHLLNQQRKVEQTLREQEHELDTIFENAPFMMLLLDEERRVRRMNTQACLFTGTSFSEMFDHRTGEALRCNHAFDSREGCGFGPYCLDCNVHNTVLDTFETGNSHYQVEASLQFSAQGKEQAILFLLSTTKVMIGDQAMVLLSLQDISEYKRIESQLLHAQKIESIGTLAGGIAHDFNNILTVIIGYGQMTLMNLAADDPERQNIENLLQAAYRAAGLANDLLLFSRKQISDKKNVELNEIVRSVEKFLRRVIGEQIACKVALDDEGPMPVLADEHQIEQVLMNFATNARDAMPGGGSLSIACERIKLDREFMTSHGFISGSSCDSYALLTVSDTGTGMDEETRRQIFDPFFTTKEVGKGTGLGMSVVYGIIKQHDGHITVDSEPGKGTTFRIYLPLIVSMADKEEIKPDDVQPHRGTETILLAEDDETVRNMTMSLLGNFGYEVVVAVDGEDAVQKFRENRERIRLLLFDVVMPKKNGKDAFEEIRLIEPGMKVIFASGYAPDAVPLKGVEKGNVLLISKPYIPSNLLAMVRSALDRSSN